MHTRLIEQVDGSYNIEWSEDKGKVWHPEVHRKIFVQKIAARLAKTLYPKAQYLGTMKG